MTSLQVLAFGCGTFFMMSCGGDDTPAVETDPTPNDSALTEVVDVEEEVEEMDYMLPSPLQIALIFNHAGLEYQDGLTNSAENAQNYVSKNSKLLNFGAYSADLSYCVVNDQSQPALDYLSTVKSLADELGLESVFNSEQLVAKFERNLSNQDSLIDILSTVQERLDEYVDDNDERFMHVVIFAGAWTESMYLGYRTTDDPNVGRKLMEQMTICQNIITGLSKNPDADPLIDEVVKQMQEANVIFENFASIKALNEEEDPDFAVIDITPDELKSLGEKMEQIRNTFVKV